MNYVTKITFLLQEAGFTFVELNASDTRSKKSLQTQVAELLGNHTLMDYMGKNFHHHVMIIKMYLVYG